MEEKYEVKGGEIDKASLTAMQDDAIVKATSDRKQMDRFIVNAFCEMYCELKKVKICFDQLLSTMAVCSKDKLDEFFVGTIKNVKKEEMRVAKQKARKAKKI